MSIDLHNHVIPRAVLDLVSAEEAYGVRINNGVWWSKNIGEFPLVDAWHDPQAKLREMDSKELDQAVAVGGAEAPLLLRVRARSAAANG